MPQKEWTDYRNEFAYYFNGFTNYLEGMADQFKLTPIERIMLFQLSMALIHFGRINTKLVIQPQIDKYRPDFLFAYDSFCQSKTVKNIVIECDGHDFHEKTKEQASRDKARDRYFTTNGYCILRYSGSDIVNNPTQVIKDLTDLLTPPITKEGD